MKSVFIGISQEIIYITEVNTSIISEYLNELIHP